MSFSRALTSSLAAGLLEAVIAAIYIDGGFDAARSFILRTFTSLIDRAGAEQSYGNFYSTGAYPDKSAIDALAAAVSSGDSCRLQSNKAAYNYCRRFLKRGSGFIWLNRCFCNNNCIGLIRFGLAYYSVTAKCFKFTVFF